MLRPPNGADDAVETSEARAASTSLAHTRREPAPPLVHGGEPGGKVAAAAVGAVWGLERLCARASSAAATSHMVRESLEPTVDAPAHAYPAPTPPPRAVPLEERESELDCS